MAMFVDIEILKGSELKTISVNPDFVSTIEDRDALLISRLTPFPSLKKEFMDNGACNFYVNGTKYITPNSKEKLRELFECGSVESSTQHNEMGGESKISKKTESKRKYRKISMSVHNWGFSITPVLSGKYSSSCLPALRERRDMQGHYYANSACYLNYNDSSSEKTEFLCAAIKHIDLKGNVVTFVDGKHAKLLHAHDLFKSLFLNEHGDQKILTITFSD